MRLLLSMKKFIKIFLIQKNEIKFQAIALLRWLQNEKDPSELDTNYTFLKSTDDDLKNLNQFLQYFEEKNVKENHESLSHSDLELRDSMLLSSYLNLVPCYLKVSHYNESLRILKEAEKIAPFSSQVLFRKSQTISYNKNSNMKNLQDARQLIIDAMKFVEQENIFKEEYKNIHQRLGLEDVKQIYKKQLDFVIERQNELKMANIQCTNC